MSKKSNSEFVTLAKKIFKDKGYEVQTSHLYDVFAQLAGYKNWHIASAKNVELTDSIKKYVIENEGLATVDGYFDNIRDSFVTLDNKEEQFSVFDYSLPAWNYAISGDKGSGKSVILLKMLYSFVKQHDNPIVCILADSGDKTYNKFVQQNKGTLINFSKELPCINLFDIDRLVANPLPSKINKIVINLLKEPNNKRTETELNTVVKEYYYQMKSSSDKENVQKELFPEYYLSSHFDFNQTFNLKVGECLPNENQVNFIASILEQMLLNNKDKNLESLNSLILDAYEIVGDRDFKYPQMSDIIDLAIRKGFNENQVNQFRKWSKNGKYPMLDKETNVDLSKNIVVVDFNGLNSQPELKSMYNYMIQQIMMNKIYFTKGCRKLIVRDELNYTDDTNLLYFIENLRTSRKNGFATITSSQVPLSYEKGEREQSMNAIISNMQVNIFTQCKSDKIQKHLVEKYLLTTPEVLELKKIGIKKINNQMYNQFMFIKGKEKIIYKNILNKQELDLYS